MKLKIIVLINVPEIVAAHQFVCNTPVFPFAFTNTRNADRRNEKSARNGSLHFSITAVTYRVRCEYFIGSLHLKFRAIPSNFREFLFDDVEDCFGKILLESKQGLYFLVSWTEYFHRFSQRSVSLRTFIAWLNSIASSGWFIRAIKLPVA